MAKGKDSATFEIIVILAIVAIVAVTGQVLIFYGKSDGSASYSAVSSSDGISGFVISEESSSETAITDLLVERIDVNPASPLIGDLFEVKVVLKNAGNQDIKTPFVVTLNLQPQSNVETEPLKMLKIMPKILAPGEEATAEFLVTAIMPEGPLRLSTEADSTGKLADMNTANNVMSKTIVVAVQ